jgi:hypothetical protein
MADRRSSHQQKTLGERKDYWETTIKGPEPTIDTSRPSADSTDYTAPPEPEPVGNLTPTLKESWLKQKWNEDPVRFIGVTLAIGLATWFAYQVFTLNREVGQQSVEINHAKKSVETVNREIEKAEKRLHEEVKVVDERLLSVQKEWQARFDTFQSQFIQKRLK